MIIEKTIQDIKPVLMPGAKPGVKSPYSMIINDSQTIFVVNPGMNGDEYNKTEGYISKYPGVQVFRCLYGQGVLVMQRNDEVGAKEFKVVSLRGGREVSVPVGFATELINIGKSFLVVIEDGVDINSKYIDSTAILEKHGLAYYIVEKKGEIGFQRNQNYITHPQITTE